MLLQLTAFLPLRRNNLVSFEAPAKLSYNKLFYNNFRCDWAYFSSQWGHSPLYDAVTLAREQNCIFHYSTGVSHFFTLDTTFIGVSPFSPIKLAHWLVFLKINNSSKVLLFGCEAIISGGLPSIASVGRWAGLDRGSRPRVLMRSWKRWRLDMGTISPWLHWNEGWARKNVSKEFKLKVFCNWNGGKLEISCQFQLIFRNWGYWWMYRKQALIFEKPRKKLLFLSQAHSLNLKFEGIWPARGIHALR